MKKMTNGTIEGKKETAKEVEQLKEQAAVRNVKLVKKILDGMVKNPVTRNFLGFRR